MNKKILPLLGLCVGALCLLGLVMLYSTAFTAKDQERVHAQLVYLAVGLVMAPLLVRLDYHWLQRRLPDLPSVPRDTGAQSLALAAPRPGTATDVGVAGPGPDLVGSRLPNSAGPAGLWNTGNCGSAPGRTAVSGSPGGPGPAGHLL